MVALGPRSCSDIFLQYQPILVCAMDGVPANRQYNQKSLSYNRGSVRIISIKECHVMNGKIVSSAGYGLVFLGFVLISGLVVLSRRHPYFVKKKLQLGALLISLSAAPFACNRVACYSPAPTNVFEVEQADDQDGEILLSRAASDTITGSIIRRVGEAFSYAILDSSEKVEQSGDISAADGAFDEPDEAFTIAVDPQVPSGRYDLRFYVGRMDSITDMSLSNWSYRLLIEE